MCNPYRGSRPPEERLSNLMLKEAGVEFNPQALRMFIRANWHLVSGYAHAIHDGKERVEEPTKSLEKD